MARPITERAFRRIAVLGAASPAGAAVKAALAGRGVDGARVDLYGHQTEVAVLSEYDGEARLVQAAGELDPASYSAVYVCESGHDSGGLAAAAAGGTLVVDLSGSIAGSALSGTPAAAAERVVAVPHAVTGLLAGLLTPIAAAAGLTRVSSFVLRPASDFGEAGLDELREQTVRLLRFEPSPTAIFGRQLAFNVLPEPLFPSGEAGSGARIVRECRALLSAPELPFTLTQALVPSFYGHAITIHAECPRGGRAEVIAALRKASGVSVSDDAEIGSTLDAPEEPGLLVVRVDPAGPSTLAVWALGAEAGAIAAERAIAVAVDAGVL